MESKALSASVPILWSDKIDFIPSRFRVIECLDTVDFLFVNRSNVCVNRPLRPAAMGKGLSGHMANQLSLLLQVRKKKHIEFGLKAYAHATQQRRHQSGQRQMRCRVNAFRCAG